MRSAGIQSISRQFLRVKSLFWFYFSLYLVYFILLGMQPTHSIADTHALVTAVGTGKGLRPGMPSIVPPGAGGIGAPGMGPRGPAPSQLGPQAPTMPKAPSQIKTNIKAANQIHPYQR